MKKLWTLCLIILSAFILYVAKPYEVCAKEYTLYDEIILSKGKLIENFTNEEENDCLNEVRGRKFWGWSTYKENSCVIASFISEVLYSYTNDGKTPIKHEFEYSCEDVSKTSISCTGSLSYSFDATSENKRFKNGLDAAVKMEYAYINTKTVKEKEKTDVTVDEGTKLVVYLVGKAKVTNGSAAYYIFWIRVHEGLYEYFQVTEEYPRMEKTPL